MGRTTAPAVPAAGLTADLISHGTHADVGPGRHALTAESCQCR